MFLATLGKHIKDMLSGRSGSISSSRVWLFGSGSIAIWLLIRIFHFMMSITNPAILAIWMGGLPSIGAILFGLAASPYYINQLSGSFSDLLNLVTSARQTMTKAMENPQIAGAVQNAIEKAQGK